MKQNHVRAVSTTRILFVLYLAALYWIIVLKFNLPVSRTGQIRSINWIPFTQPVMLNGKADNVENILNVLIFLPLGIYSAVLFRAWRWSRHLLLFFLISLICEISQYLMKIGVSDSTDLLTNVTGGVLGMLVVSLIGRWIPDDQRRHRFINGLAMTGTFLFILFILLLKINHLWIFRMELIHPRMG